MTKTEENAQKGVDMAISSVARTVINAQTTVRDAQIVPTAADARLVTMVFPVRTLAHTAVGIGNVTKRPVAVRQAVQ